MDILADGMPHGEAAILFPSVTMEAQTEIQTDEQSPVMGYPFLLAHSDIEIHPP